MLRSLDRILLYDKRDKHPVSPALSIHPQKPDRFRLVREHRSAMWFEIRCGIPRNPEKTPGKLRWCLPERWPQST
jgi:hypothetical protein